MPPFKRCPLASLQRFQIECVSVPSAKPQWIQAVKDTALAIEERLHWECRANGKPKPSYTWLKNGQQLLSGVNYSLSSATYQYFILKTKSAASAHLLVSSGPPLALSFFSKARFRTWGAQTSHGCKCLSVDSTLADYAVLESGSGEIAQFHLNGVRGCSSLFMERVSALHNELNLP